MPLAWDAVQTVVTGFNHCPDGLANELMPSLVLNFVLRGLEYLHETVIKSVSSCLFSALQLATDGSMPLRISTKWC